MILLCQILRPIGTVRNVTYCNLLFFKPQLFYSARPRCIRLLTWKNRTDLLTPEPVEAFIARSTAIVTLPAPGTDASARLGIARAVVLAVAVLVAVRTKLASWALCLASNPCKFNKQQELLIVHKLTKQSKRPNPKLVLNRACFERTF